MANLNLLSAAWSAAAFLVSLVLITLIATLHELESNVNNGAHDESAVALTADAAMGGGCAEPQQQQAWPWEEWPEYGAPGAQGLLRHISDIAVFRNKREAAAAGHWVSGVFQPFEQHSDRKMPPAPGMPAVPRCANFSSNLGYPGMRTLEVVGCSPGWTCRQYECFRRCRTSFDPVRAATWATAYGMCRPEAPVCMFGYCLQIGRVDYQRQLEHIAARIQQGNAGVRPVHVHQPRPETLEWTRYPNGRNGPFPVKLTMSTTVCRNSRDLEDVTDHRTSGDVSPYLECLAASHPICYGYVEGRHYGVCTPVYPNIHSALWRSFGMVEPNFVEFPRSYQLGLCDAYALSIPKMLTNRPTGWKWECVPYREKFYNSMRWHIGSSDVMLDPILWNHGYKSIDMQYDSPTWKEHRASIPYEWDIFLGGHVHGGGVYWNELDAAKLSPHHIVSSCRGCLERYCSKKGLCEDAINAGVNGMVGPVCKLMPDGDTDILADLESGNSAGWVIKRDGLDQHLGRGTTIITNLEDYKTLRKPWLDGDGKLKVAASTFSAQQYVAPWLGVGRFHRKMEIRAYAMITSTNPLRLYLWPDAIAVLAFSTYSDSPRKNSSSPAWCMHDTHIFREGSDRCETDGLTPHDRSFTLDRWCELNGHTVEACSTIRTKYGERLRNAVLSSHRGVAEHPFNEGVTVSNARCFSLLRADITLGADLEPYIMEINQDPYIPHAYAQEPLVTLFQRELFMEYFSMVGVTPYRRPPIQPELFREMTAFCVDQMCTASEFLALQRMVAEQQQVVKFVPLFPTMDAAVPTPPVEWRRMRALLPDAQQGFDAKLERWFGR